MRTLIVAFWLVGCAGTTDGTVSQALCTMNSADPCCPGSPIIVDLKGDGIHLTSAADGVLYTLRRGQLGQWAWTERGSDDAFLVLDLDGSGRIDDGSEMFGDGSMQIASASPNGFAALAYYDLPKLGGNGDGVIDALDAIWPRLRLWRDIDHDAFSATNEMTTLDADGVHSFALVATPSSGVDANGNEFRFSSTIVADEPVSLTVSDVWLTQRPIPDDEDEAPAGRTDRDYTKWTCWAWAYAIQYVSPDTSPNPTAVACDLPWVLDGPLASTATYPFTRLVVRRSSGSNAKSTYIASAALKVQNAVEWDAMTFGFTPCSTYGWPYPDTYYAPPYDREDSGVAAELRVKCFSELIHTGGGGGDGCLIDDPI